MSELTKRSDTHKELYFHILPQSLVELMGAAGAEAYPFKGATVFYRQEADGIWYVTAALCAWEDQFERRVGRNVSRRRYFNSPVRFEHGVNKPVFDDALDFFEVLCGRYEE